MDAREVVLEGQMLRRQLLAAARGELGGDPAAAEDCVQDVFCAVLLSEVADVRNAATFLYVAVQRRARSMGRRERLAPRLDQEAIETRTRVADVGCEVELLDEVACLTSAPRAALLAWMGTGAAPASPGEKTALHRARRALRASAVRS